MKDWRAIARARGLDLPERDLDLIAQPLDSLEAVFRPLVQNLGPEAEPSFCFQPEED